MMQLFHILALICCCFVVGTVLSSNTEHVDHVIRKRQTPSIEIGFIEEDYEANEDTGVIEVQLQIRGPTTQPLTIRLIPHEYQNAMGLERATSGIDFEIQEISFTLEPISQSRVIQTVPIPIIPDDIDEADQVFELDLLVEGSADITITRNTTLLRILDNDEVILIWQFPIYTFQETLLNQVTLIKADGTSTEHELDIFIQVVQPHRGFAATYIQDFTFGGAQQGASRTGVSESIKPNEQNLTINFVILRDEIFEGTEEFLLRVSNDRDGAPFTSIVNGTLLDTADVFIIDNIEVGFVQTSINVSEDQGMVKLCVALDLTRSQTVAITKIQRAIPLGISIVNGSAGAEDYSDMAGQTLILDNEPPTLNSSCFTINITDDNIFEGDEAFTVTLYLASNESGLVQTVTLNPDVATIRIIDNDDSAIAIIVNDTVIGDPLLTVPINVINLDSENITSNLSLCFELHGESGRYFNLVSDQCVSVNSHYDGVGIFNIVDEIAVNAVDEMGVCHNITVSLEDKCSATLDGAVIDKMATVDGISIRKYTSRVRISVPNCEDRHLVMWVFCLNQTLKGYDKDVLVEMEARMMKFVIARGFNLMETSHGILGQFWNIPVTIQRYDGLLSNGQTAENYFNVTVIPPTSPPRSFPGFYWPTSWEYPSTGELQPCLYSGTKNAGPTSEIADLPDSVIEGSYQDYIVDEPYNTNFKYNQFAGQCQE